MTFLGFLRKRAAIDGDRLAYVFPGGRLNSAVSYTTLDRDARAIAVHLLAQVRRSRFRSTRRGPINGPIAWAACWAIASRAWP